MKILIIHSNKNVLAGLYNVIKKLNTTINNIVPYDQNINLYFNLYIIISIEGI